LFHGAFQLDGNVKHGGRAGIVPTASAGADAALRLLGLRRL
jgi:hypothetical protein